MKQKLEGWKVVCLLVLVAASWQLLALALGTHSGYTLLLTIGFWVSWIYLAIKLRVKDPVRVVGLAGLVNGAAVWVVNRLGSREAEYEAFFGFSSSGFAADLTSLAAALLFGYAGGAILGWIVLRLQIRKANQKKF